MLKDVLGRPSALKKHGMCETGAYSSWRCMMSRCNIKTHGSWEMYGGAGIKVCEYWKDFRNFYADMGDRPEGHSLDRVDGSKGYNKLNCRWADVRTQARNVRYNKRTQRNKEGIDLHKLSAESGLSYGCLWSRIFEKGLTPEQATSFGKMKAVKLGVQFMLK